MSRYRTLFLQRRARLVCGWVTMTDRGLSRMHGFSAKVSRWVTLTDEWPDDFRKVGIVTSTLLSRVTEGWIFYVSGLAIMSVGMTGCRMTGRHRRTGTASVQYIYYQINLISFLKILFLTISHTKSKTSPNRFRNHNVAGALPYVLILGTSGSLVNLQPPKKNNQFSL